MAEWVDFDSDGGGANTADNSDEEDSESAAKRPRLQQNSDVGSDHNVNEHEMSNIGTRDLEIIDELGELEDDGVYPSNREDDDDSEVSDDYDLDDEEIDALLEEGIQIDRKGAGDGQTTGESTAPIRRDKVVLKEIGHDPFEILPEGWVVVTHNSGMPVFLHKQSRVCTMSKPYFLGPGSARKHEIPVSAIPCLHYKRELKKTQEFGGEKEGVVNDLQNDVVQPQGPPGQSEAKETKDCLSSDNTSQSAAMLNGLSSPQDQMETENTNTSIIYNTSEVSSMSNGSATPQPPQNPPLFPPPPNYSPPPPPPEPSSDQLTSTSVSTIIPNGCDVTHIPNGTTQGETILPGSSGDAGVPAVTVKIESAEERNKITSLCPMELRSYCRNLFEFKTITVRKFKTWKDRRKHHSLLKKQHRPGLPGNTRLITCPIPSEKGDDKKKEFVLNPSGKSFVCILHEYVQHAMRVQPKYIFKELENAQTPYSATVVIEKVEYGTGYASSKKSAKMDAAKSTLSILIPEMVKVTQDENKKETEDLSFFDEIKIEDPRIFELCSKAGQPSPYQILQECLKRNYGMGDTQCKMEMKQLKHQKNEFFMSVGKHEAKVACKNKREGKQYAAQAILQLLHPHVQSWGSLLRLYGRGSCNAIREKKQEEQSVTHLQVNAKANRPNTAVLDKLKKEMTKLETQKAAIKSKGTFRINAQELPANVTSINL